MNNKNLALSIHQYLEETIKNIGFNAEFILYIKLVVLLLFLFIIILIANSLSKSILNKILRNISSRTSTYFDNFLLKNNFSNYLARLIPLAITGKLVDLIFLDFPQFISTVNLFINIYAIFVSVLIIQSLLKSLRDYLKIKDSFKDKPIDSYIQVMIIILYFIGWILVFTTVTGKSVLTFFTTLGAASAILLLIFKDTILGFVASIQVTVNDMVRIGDWITMDKYGADGDVIEITLTTVKVQNFDKTITTIPTYNLISDSFKNWRGMQSSGGRRIKRAIRIKISSVKYLSDNDVENLKKIHLINPYLSKVLKELQEENERNHVDRSLLINGRNLTNIGVFRVYIDEYLKHNPYLHPEMTMMVRQLEPKNDGIPLELYTFTNDIKWTNYERIMADIFDHILAAVIYFDLEIFESPSSGDFKSLITQSAIVPSTPALSKATTNAI
jgi:miniconductance mechanosensitive channel